MPGKIKTKAADKDLRELAIARGSTLLDLRGIGPSGAALLLADVGDIHRFVSPDRFASWNGPAHIKGVVQLRNPTAGRRP